MRRHARSRSDGRPPDRGRRARRRRGHPDALGDPQGAARARRALAARARAGRAARRSAPTSRWWSSVPAGRRSPRTWPRSRRTPGAGRAGRAARHRARGPGRARARCPTSTAPCWCCPATRRCCAPETLRRLVEEHQSSGAVATLLTAVLADPTGYGRVVRGAAGGGPAASSSTATPTTPSGRSPRSTRASTRSSRGPLRDALARLSTANAQGEEYLTDVVGSFVAAGLPVGARARAGGARPPGSTTASSSPPRTGR